MSKHIDMSARPQMSHETAMFASLLLPPEGVDELEYLRAAQDCLDTAKPHALGEYGKLQARIVAVLDRN